MSPSHIHKVTRQTQSVKQKNKSSDNQDPVITLKNNSKEKIKAKQSKTNRKEANT